MQKWEYLTLNCVYWSLTLLVEEINGEKPDAKLPLRSVLARLGGEGWEMINMYHLESEGNRQIVVLKRPAE